jgi:2-polyprenyl-6-methoxyphenol hydroxylase-like FAD-dependent oxidoreductase
MAAALFLHRAGHQVEIFERFQTVRPLGSGLLIQPSGQKVFAALGLLPELQSQSARVEHLAGISVRSGKRALAMAYGDLGQGVHALGVHRAVLFNVLYNAVQAAGIPVHSDCEMGAGSVRENESGVLVTCGNHEWQGDFAIDAMGARSPLASGRVKPMPYGAFWATVDMPEGTAIAKSALDQRYFRARQMAGIMPVGTSPFTGKPAAAVFWSARQDQVAAITAHGIEKWRRDFCQLWPDAEPFLVSVASFNDLTFAQYQHRTGKAVQAARLFHIGDSWHCTSPQLGQGANMALIDAAALSRAINQADGLPAIGPAYAAMRLRHVRIYQALSRVFTPLYQSNALIGPWLRDQVVHYTANISPVSRFVARIVAGDLGNRFSA